MEFGFLDESGDPGDKGSKHLVLTLMITKRKKDVIRVIRNTKKRMLDKSKTSKWLNRMGGEIKFYNFPDKKLLEKLIKDLSQIDMYVYYITFEKDLMKRKNLPPPYKKNKIFIVFSLFQHILENSDRKIPKIIADLNFFNTSKTCCFLLKGYEKNKSLSFSILDDIEYKKIKSDKTKLIIQIKHQNSRLHEELQAVDIISGSIFQAYEHNNKKYLSLLKNNKSKIKIYGDGITSKNKN